MREWKEANDTEEGAGGMVWYMLVCWLPWDECRVGVGNCMSSCGGPRLVETGVNIDSNMDVLIRGVDKEAWWDDVGRAYTSNTMMT